MSGWLILLVALLLLPLALLSLPINLRGQVCLAEGWQGSSQVSCLAGLVRLQLQVEEAQPHAALHIGGWTRPLRQGSLAKLAELRPMLTSATWQALKRFLLRLLAALRLRYRIDGVYGMGDPALTGYLTALLAASGCQQINLTPDFTGANLDITGELRATIIPAQLLWLSGGFFFSAPIRSLWWTYLRQRKATHLKEVA